MELNWGENANPVEDLREFKKKMLDPNTTKEYFYKIRLHKKFIYKQIIIIYFTSNPISTLEKCLNDLGINKNMNDYELVLEVVKEMIDSGDLIPLKD